MSDDQHCWREQLRATLLRQQGFNGPRGWLGRPATCDEVDMSMTPLVETVARIIDPSKWAVLDSYLADMLRKYKGEHIGYDPEPFKDKASMAKAQAAIAAVFDALDI